MLLPDKQRKIKKIRKVHDKDATARITLRRFLPEKMDFHMMVKVMITRLTNS
jgi:hypothetical protein